MSMCSNALKLTKTVLPVALGVFEKAPNDAGTAKIALQCYLYGPFWEGCTGDWIGAKKISASILSIVGIE
ncbi:hypothetical protein EON65_51230 [archaeon]|nr:MAG: hypothetical protein EON65_51230 [archaeon]